MAYFRPNFDACLFYIKIKFLVTYFFIYCRTENNWERFSQKNTFGTTMFKNIWADDDNVVKLCLTSTHPHSMYKSKQYEGKFSFCGAWHEVQWEFGRSLSQWTFEVYNNREPRYSVKNTLLKVWNFKVARSVVLWNSLNFPKKNLSLLHMHCILMTNCQNKWTSRCRMQRNINV